MNIFQNYDFQVAQSMHKAVHSELPVPLRYNLTIDNAFFYFKPSRIKQTQKSISYAGPNIWNSLPTDYVQESDFKKFKSNLKQFLLNK